MDTNGRTILLSTHVAQASGMVSVQAHCTPNEAIEIMKARAEATACTLEEIAAAVLDHSIRFDV
jgi:AmiR/NasT family two-component response regulator